MGSDFEELDRYSPGDAADPHGDLLTLHHLEERGADLAKPTAFIHHLAFAERQHAVAAGQEITEKLGYRARGRAPDEPSGKWLLSAEREEVPTSENVDRMRTVLSMVAENFGGTYDGWEAAVTR